MTLLPVMLASNDASHVDSTRSARSKREPDSPNASGTYAFAATLAHAMHPPIVSNAPRKPEANSDLDSRGSGVVTGVGVGASDGKPAFAAAAEARAAAASSPPDSANSDPDALNPDFRARLGRVITRMHDEFGKDVQLVEGFRTQSRQDYLYDQGRSRPGDVVTWTKASKHTLGLAADVTIDGSYADAAGYKQLAQVAAQEGLRTLGSRDPGHIELPTRGGAAAWGPSNDALNIDDNVSRAIGIALDQSGSQNIDGTSDDESSRLNNLDGLLSRAGRSTGAIAPAFQMSMMAGASGTGFSDSAKVAGVATVADVANVAQVAQVARIAGVMQLQQPILGAPPALRPLNDALNTGDTVSRAIGIALDLGGSQNIGGKSDDDSSSFSNFNGLLSRAGRSAGTSAPLVQTPMMPGGGGMGSNSSQRSFDDSHRDSTRFSDSAKVAGVATVADASNVVQAVQMPHIAGMIQLQQPTLGVPAVPAVVVGTGSEAADKVGRMLDARDAAPVQPLSQMTLNIDNASGAADKVTVQLRSGSVDTAISLGDPNRADRMSLRVGELQHALEQHGLDATAITVASTASGSGPGWNPRPGSDQSAQNGRPSLNYRDNRQDADGTRQRSRREQQGGKQ